MYIFDIVPAKLRKEHGYPWRLVYVSDQADSKNSPFRQYLEVLRDKNQDEFDNLMQFFRACSEHGPEGLPSKTRHHLDQNNQIFEFIKGRHRIAWFYDEGKIVVCTHGFFKKTQKAPKEEQQKAAKLKEEYFAAKKHGNLNEIKGR